MSKPLVVRLVPKKLPTGDRCDRPELPVHIRCLTTGGRGEYLAFTFIVDTGSAVTTISTCVAEDWGIPFESTTDPVDGPKTLVGRRLRGHWGHVRVILLGSARVWPCFFFLPPDGPADKAAPQGQPGQRHVSRQALTVQEWEQRVGELLTRRPHGEQTGPEEKPPVLVLGRSGFLRDYAISIKDDHLTVTLQKKSQG